MFRLAKGKGLAWETSSEYEDKRDSDDGRSYYRNYLSKAMKKGTACDKAAFSQHAKVEWVLE